MKANAGGVATDAGLPAANVPMIVSSLPEGLQKEIEGSKEGDIRLYVAPRRACFTWSSSQRWFPRMYSPSK